MLAHLITSLQAALNTLSFLTNCFHCEWLFHDFRIGIIAYVSLEKHLAPCNPPTMCN